MFVYILTSQLIFLIEIYGRSKRTKRSQSDLKRSKNFIWDLNLDLLVHLVL